VAAPSEARNIFARSNTGIGGLNTTRGMDICLRLFCVSVVLLGWADPPSKASCQPSIRSVVPELILNANRPKSLIREGSGTRNKSG
jgi:hypothetical protein